MILKWILYIYTVPHGGGGDGGGGDGGGGGVVFLQWCYVS
jgi:hypothetical protein